MLTFNQCFKCLKKYPTKHKPEGTIALFPISHVFKLVFAHVFFMQKKCITNYFW